MKKLLNLLRTISLIGTTSVSVVACIPCNDEFKQKNLNTITQLTGLDITVNTSKKWNELIGNINNFTEFKFKPLANGYKINYYNDFNKNITNEYQHLDNISKIFVEISSNLNDPNYNGSTKIDITNQTIILDNTMENEIKDTIFENWKDYYSISIKMNEKQKALQDILEKLDEKWKKILVLKGLYWEKYNSTFFFNEKEIYYNDNNTVIKPVPDDWFKTLKSDQLVIVKLFYNKTHTMTSGGILCPIKLNITK
ncbi:lipoprotein [Spiroplasma endosymbiont of Nebria brevicollis]|uniref:lipoprotein n=1 Tax=Spiroplasma endosymbiont of Nebria brevicollis TaxID=3066284 RepID=UPI00313EFCBA